MIIRTLIFIALTAGLIAGGLWVADHPGTVVIDWQTPESWGFRGLQVELWLAALAVLVFALAAIIVDRLLRLVVKAPGAFARWRRTSRRARGYRALTQGLVAVAAGDPEQARRQSRRADALLNEPPLTLLLSAQSAQLSGDEATAELHFKEMLKRPETAFLGVRGLLTQAVKAGKVGDALDFARKAHKLRPQTPWVLTTLFDLEARCGNWAAAEAVLADAARAGVVNTLDARRHRAALLVEQSDASTRRGEPEQALTAARQAHDLAPGMVPASVRLARLLAAEDRRRKAERVLERTWSMNPHPALAAAYAGLADPKLDETGRVRRMTRLTTLVPQAADGHIAVAEAALAARLWGEARTHLMQVVDHAGTPNRRALRLLAEVEEHERGDRDAARSWLARAAVAPDGPSWRCESCGTAAADWSARCGNCGSFDTLMWRMPPAPVLLPADIVHEPVALAAPGPGRGDGARAHSAPAAANAATVITEPTVAADRDDTAGVKANAA